VRLGGDRDVGHDLPPRLVDAAHRAGVVVGDPQRTATDGEALRAGAGADRLAREPVGRWVDPRHAVAAAAGVGHPDRPRRGREVKRRPADRDGGHRAAGRQVDAGHPVVARRAEVPGGDAGDPQRPVADGDGLSVRRDPQRLAEGRVGRGVDPNHRAGGAHPNDPAGHGHAPGAGEGDDRGEPAAVEGGHGGTGGRGRRLGRP
jgi:hypothetical protein